MCIHDPKYYLYIIKYTLNHLPLLLISMSIVRPWEILEYKQTEHEITNRHIDNIIKQNLISHEKLYK